MSSSGVSGQTVPTRRYDHAISSEFPSNNRKYLIDGSISNRYMRDYMPINANIANGSVNEAYLEFSIPGSEQEFLDLSSLSIELGIKIVTTAGNDVPNDADITLVDGFGHRILQKCSVFLNSVPVESNSYFGLWNSLCTYLSMSKSDLPGEGRAMYYKDMTESIVRDYTAAAFNDEDKCYSSILADIRDEVNCTVPLNLNISHADFFLLNGVDMRIRIELASPACVINAVAGSNYQYRVDSARLWAQKITPAPSALLSLNRHLTNDAQTIEYIFPKPVIKTYVFPQTTSSLCLDNIFQGVIPQQMYVCMMRQDVLNGSINLNGAYMEHCGISSIRLEVDGHTVSYLQGRFTGRVTQFYTHLMNNVKSKENLLSYSTFKEGRTLFCWDLRDSTSNDIISIEKRGNLRLSINTGAALTGNVTVFVMGVVTGVVDINATRSVQTNYLL